MTRLFKRMIKYLFRESFEFTDQMNSSIHWVRAPLEFTLQRATRYGVQATRRWSSRFSVLRAMEFKPRAVGVHASACRAQQKRLRKQTTPSTSL